MKIRMEVTFIKKQKGSFVHTLVPIFYNHCDSTINHLVLREVTKKYSHFDPFENLLDQSKIENELLKLKYVCNILFPFFFESDELLIFVFTN